MDEPDSTGPGSRGVARHIETLRDLDRDTVLRYVRMERPDAAAGTPRRYIVDYGLGEEALLGPEVVAFARGFRAAFARIKADAENNRTTTAPTTTTARRKP